MNEDKFELDGKTYIAKESKDCSECAFETNHKCVAKTPECSALTRKDKKSVIFVELKEPEMNIQQEIKDLREKLERLEKEGAAKEKSEWPKDGDTYYFVNSDTTTIRDTWTNHDVDYNRKSIGNIFKTEEEAKAEIEARKVVAELRATEGRMWQWKALPYRTLF